MNSLNVVYLFLARLKITVKSRQRTIAHKLASVALRVAGKATRSACWLACAAQVTRDGDYSSLLIEENLYKMAKVFQTFLFIYSHQ